MQFGRTYELVVARPIETNYITTGEEVPLYKYQAVQDNIIGLQEELDAASGALRQVFKPSSSSNIKKDLEEIGRKDYRGGVGALKITENHITFNVDKKESGSTNKAEVRVYNLSDESVSFLDSVSGKGVLAGLSAGYGGENKTIFLGTLESVTDKFNDVDRVTTLHVSDGGKFIRDSLMSKIYPAGTSVISIIHEMIDNMGLVRGVIETFKEGQTLRTRLPVSGSTYSALLRLADNYGYKISVQDLSVNAVIEAKLLTSGQGGEEKRIAKVFSASSGLIGFVGISNDNAGRTAVNSQDSKNGVEFSVLLDGSIKVGTLIKLETIKYSGVYRVTEVSHKGSLEGNDWTTNIKAEKADFR